MSGLQKYLLQLTAAGLVCAGAVALCGKAKKELVRFCCACILALVALAPLTRGEIQLPEITYKAEVQTAVDDAIKRATKEQTAKTEQALAEDAVAFARQYGLSLTAAITCQEDGKVVKQVILNGTANGGKAAFIAALAQRFGIPAESIQWEG